MKFDDVELCKLWLSFDPSVPLLTTPSQLTTKPLPSHSWIMSHVWYFLSSGCTRGQIWSPKIYVSQFKWKHFQSIFRSCNISCIFPRIIRFDWGWSNQRERTETSAPRIKSSINLVTHSRFRTALDRHANAPNIYESIARIIPWQQALIGPWYVGKCGLNYWEIAAKLIVNVFGNLSDLTKICFPQIDII